MAHVEVRIRRCGGQEKIKQFMIRAVLGGSLQMTDLKNPTYLINYYQTKNFKVTSTKMNTLPTTISPLKAIEPKKRRSFSNLRNMVSASRSQIFGTAKSTFPRLLRARRPNHFRATKKARSQWSFSLPSETISDESCFFFHKLKPLLSRFAEVQPILDPQIVQSPLPSTYSRNRAHTKQQFHQNRPLV